MHYETICCGCRHVAGQPRPPLGRPCDHLSRCAYCWNGCAPASPLLNSPPLHSIPYARASTGTDTLRITRSQAIAQALAHNPQLAVAHEQTAEAHAQRVQNIGIPDPTGTAAIQPQRGQPTAKPVTVGIDIPFPTSSACSTGSAQPAVGQAQAMEQRADATDCRIPDGADLRFLARLTAAPGRPHRQPPTRGRTFLAKTEARYAAGHCGEAGCDSGRGCSGARPTPTLLANGRDITAGPRLAQPAPSAGRLRLPIAPADSLIAPPASAAARPRSPIGSAALSGAPGADRSRGSAAGRSCVHGAGRGVLAAGHHGGIDLGSGRAGSTYFPTRGAVALVRALASDPDLFLAASQR